MISRGPLVCSCLCYDVLYGAVEMVMLVAMAVEVAVIAMPWLWLCLLCMAVVAVGIGTDNGCEGSDNGAEILLYLVQVKSTEGDWQSALTTKENQATVADLTPDTLCVSTPHAC